MRGNLGGDRSLELGVHQSVQVHDMIISLYRDEIRRLKCGMLCEQLLHLSCNVRIAGATLESARPVRRATRERSEQEAARNVCRTHVHKRKPRSLVHSVTESACVGQAYYTQIRKSGGRHYKLFGFVLHGLTTSSVQRSRLAS